MASGQAAMLRRRNTTEPTNPFSVQTLTRLLHLLDALTQNTYLDAQDAGPFFLHALLRIVPPKLPIDLRPVMLRVIHRLAVGMSRDRRPEGRCFAQEHAIAMIHALTPILENPRSGASASFVVHEIKNVIETCLQREMGCKASRGGSDLDEDDGPNDTAFRVSTPKMELELGMIESGDAQRLSNLCGFSLPSLLGISPLQSCLGYRCSLLRSNLMRNGSVDSYVTELVFRNASMTLSPAFRTQSINFSLPLTPEFSKRVQKGGRPKCVWYEREGNATASRWSDRGCTVLGFNRKEVNCSCSHLTEFAILIPEVRRPLNLSARWWLLGALLSLAAAVGAMAIWSLQRRHAYETDVKLGKREPRSHRRMHGPPTREQHLLRRQWRLRDSDENTLLDDADDQSRTLGSKSTLTAGGDRESRHRTMSMASTLYARSEPGTHSDDTLEDDDPGPKQDPNHLSLRNRHPGRNQTDDALEEEGDVFRVEQDDDLPRQPERRGTLFDFINWKRQ